MINFVTFWDHAFWDHVLVGILGEEGLETEEQGKYCCFKVLHDFHVGILFIWGEEGQETEY